MAAERYFELVDDYLTNRLSAADAAEFEKQVQADPQLAQELTIQQELVGGLKKARAAELKAMLNNVPVSPVQGGSSALVKVGTSVVVAGLIATGLYFYFAQDEEGDAAKTIAEQPVTPAPELKSAESTQTQPVQPQPEQPQPNQQPAVVEEREKKKETTASSEPVTKPKAIEAYDPSAEESEAAVKKFETEQLAVVSKAFVTSSIEVEMDTMNKKYTFHYVFRDGKLILYGAFEKHLYEILEFIGDEKRTVVLFYKTNYYLLDISKTTPTKLTAIRDQKLLKKLQEHRSH
jgi:hypothetical protein